jgi:hypothetical protein
LIRDILDLSRWLGKSQFAAVVHGGLMEHFPSEQSIRRSLEEQLLIAPQVIFDVPISSPKNDRLFTADEVFRQPWTTADWHNTLHPFNISEYSEETHVEPGMTDDLVVAITA